MNIEQLASGTWRARVYLGLINGKREYKSITGRTRKEVEYQAAVLQMQQKQKKTELAKPAEERMSVGDAIDSYINNVNGVLSPTTIRRYKSDREKFFPSLMKVKLSDLTQELVQQAVTLDSKKYAPKSIKCAHGLLSAALAVYLPDFKLKTNLPQQVTPDVFVPENEEIQNLLNKIRGTWLELAVLLGACCGMRRSEICGLKYTDIDAKKNTITVRRTIVKDENGKWVIREATKTVKSKRKIEVAPFIIKKLLSYNSKNDFIIDRLPDTISKEFIDVRNSLGLSFRFHDLRHYNASIMLALGVPDKYAMERMGYSTPATLKKVYQHTMREKQKEVAAVVNNQMEQLFETAS